MCFGTLSISKKVAISGSILEKNTFLEEMACSLAGILEIYCGQA
jgi:hypothetical protein